VIPEVIRKLIKILMKFPSIGPRQATRLAFHLVHQEKSQLENFEQTLKELQKMRICPNCFFPYQGNYRLCPICRDNSRDKHVITIVEKETDLISIEKTKTYKGNYLILGGLAKREMLEPAQKQRLNALERRIKYELGGKVKEIVIALNPNTYGDFTFLLIKKQFENLADKITRLGRGIPTGGEIEFADKQTLIEAFKRRS